MLETIIEYLRTRPGYRKEGANRLAERMQRNGFDVNYTECKKALYQFNKELEMGADDDMLDDINVIKKSAQRAADINRIERKIWRNRTRTENALVELNKELITAVNDEGLSIKTIDHPGVEPSDNKMLVQLSDLHLNELVDIEGNKYDFNIASQRLQKYAQEIKVLAAAKGVSELVIVFTGDLINSDRRTDEMLNAATNRAHASILATKLLGSFILDLQQEYDIFIISVSGNESRIKDDFSLDNFIISDNYDFLIYNMLKLLLAEKDGIVFLDTNQFETIISANGANILITHGTTIKKDVQHSIQQIIGKHAVKGDRVDYVLFGHIHFANITDLYSRSGSLVGSNVYSDRQLGFVSQASQVIHIVDKNGDISNYRINLQNADYYDGYPIKSDYDAYEPRLNNKSINSKIIKV